MFHFHRELCEQGNSSYGFLKIKQFIMIRKLVLVKESVTDFCCVLNVIGMEVPSSVLKYCLASHIHDFKHKMLQIL